MSNRCYSRYSFTRLLSFIFPGGRGRGAGEPQRRYHVVGQVPAGRAAVLTLDLNQPPRILIPPRGTALCLDCPPPTSDRSARWALSQTSNKQLDPPTTPHLLMRSTGVIAHVAKSATRIGDLPLAVSFRHPFTRRIQPPPILDRTEPVLQPVLDPYLTFARPLPEQERPPHAPSHAAVPASDGRVNSMRTYNRHCQISWSDPRNPPNRDRAKDALHVLALVLALAGVFLFMGLPSYSGEERQDR